MQRCVSMVNVRKVLFCNLHSIFPLFFQKKILPEDFRENKWRNIICIRCCSKDIVVPCSLKINIICIRCCSKDIVVPCSLKINFKVKGDFVSLYTSQLLFNCALNYLSSYLESSYSIVLRVQLYAKLEAQIDAKPENLVFIKRLVCFYLTGLLVWCVQAWNKGTGRNILDHQLICHQHRISL